MAKLVEVVAEKQAYVGNSRVDSVLVSSRWTRSEGDGRDDEGGQYEKTYISVFSTSPSASDNKLLRIC